DALLPQPATPHPLAAREHHMARGTALLPGLQGHLLADVHTVLPNDMLHKVDLTSMAHALEVRTPFLDRRVVELAFALPVALKLRRGTGKALLREAFGALLPAGITERRKQGFEVPLRDLFLGPLRPLVDGLLTRERCLEAGLNWEAVQAVRARMASARPGQAQATVHALLVYLAWWRRSREHAS
ncbi:MAG: hypothetical protein HUU33_07950, partial [Flavobacteriales bacterium]|nr:hypothetical protein [Flavobacteriales bacterium]